MADDPELTARVRRALGDVPDVVERRMFGSVGFLVRGTLRIAAGTHPDHVAMVRVREEDEATALAVPGAKPAVMRGAEMHGWLFLEREAVQTDEQLAHWVTIGLAAVPSASS